MAMINIGGDKMDRSYRYKMPRLIPKIEGRGNGIKTVIVNCVDIAKALHVDPAYVTKFFGIELGAQSTYQAKTERSIVNGAHDLSLLTQTLEKFIEMFVLCPNCRLPELTMTVSKHIKFDCAACGHNNILKSAHRLATYILKNPPGKKGGSSSSSKKDKKKRKKSRRDREREEAADEKEVEAAPAEDSKAVEEVAQPDAPVAEAKTEWFTDTSREAMEERRMQEMAEMKAQKAAEAIMSSSIKNLKKEAPVSVLRLFLGDRERQPNEIESEVRRLQMSRGLDDTQKVQVLVQALIDPSTPKTVPAQFKKHAPTLSLFAQDRPTALVLIGCIEELLGKLEKKLVVLVPHVIKVLYMEDVLDEETLVAWHNSPPETSWLVSKAIATDIRRRATVVIDAIAAASGSEDESDGD